MAQTLGGPNWSTPLRRIRQMAVDAARSWSFNTTQAETTAPHESGGAKRSERGEWFLEAKIPASLRPGLEKSKSGKM